MTTQAETLIDQYLRRLRMAARPLPRGHRGELIEQIAEHLDEAIPPDASELDARNALERLGDPEEIVGEEIDRLGLGRPRAGRLELAAVILIPVGMIVFPLVGWVAGVACLWLSRVWSVRDKLIGTLLPPGGFGAIAILLVVGARTCGGATTFVGATLGRTTCSGPSPTLTIPLLILFVVCGLATPIYLAVKANRTRA